MIERRTTVKGYLKKDIWAIQYSGRGNRSQFAQLGKSSSAIGRTAVGFCLEDLQFSESGDPGGSKTERKAGKIDRRFT